MNSNPLFERTWGDRVKASLFYSPAATGLTVVIAFALAVIFWVIADWGLVHAVWRPDHQACYAAQGGACWGFVAEKWRLILFGRYPYDEQWRPAAATLAIVAMLVVTAMPRFWTRRGSRVIAWGWAAAFAAFFALMYGGVAGLSPIGTDSWGGLPLTVILTLLGMTASAPVGILLALGRRSKMPVVRLLSTGYIEVVRGVPLITVLFVASFIFPLLLPQGVRFDPFWRVAGGIILFQAAYMAETVRGGLQTVPRGQYLAADSLGLRPWQTYCHVILPQALVAVIPAFVNSLLSTFMDTSLVTVVSMYDLTGSLSLALGDANWRNFFREGYIFVAAIYFASSLVMSRYSQWLERRLSGDKKQGEVAI
ncbi:MAG: amino acid ABC transporter permease [Duodenibacillus sp.]|nr:amino acid ABC transporter permease [Duodenibacillus sp.]